MFLGNTTPIHWVAWLVAIVSIACSGSSVDRGRPDGGTGTPSSPSDVDRARLLGPDRDRDGIRDDVQAFIADAYGEDPTLKKRLERTAALQQLILRDFENEAKTKASYRLLMSELDCLYYENPASGSRAVAEAMAELLNSKERSLAYLRANAHMGGTMWEIPTDEALAERCSE